MVHVRFDDLELLRRQLPRLGEDVLRHPQLADVVQQRRDLHRLHLLRRETEPLRQADRVLPHPVDVLVGVTILGVDRHRQRSDHRVVQLVQLGEVRLLLPDLVRVEPVGVIDDVEEGRRQQQNRVESPMLVGPRKRRGAGRARQVAGHRPEIILPPHLQQPQPLRPGHRGGRAHRVHAGNRCRPRARWRTAAAGCSPAGRRPPGTPSRPRPRRARGWPG